MSAALPEHVHDAFARTFLHKLVAVGQHERAFALHILDKPLIRQLAVRSGDGEHADVQFLGKLPEGGERLAGLQFAPT